MATPLPSSYQAILTIAGQAAPVLVRHLSDPAQIVHLVALMQSNETLTIKVEVPY